MKSNGRLSGDERRAAIIKTARRVFAEKGFHGTTTRQLAEAASVSEALLFKHFPNKEALFSAIQLSCCNEQDAGRFERLKALEPSAATLVLVVHFLVSLIVESGVCGEEDQEPYRLMVRSLVEDGEFARILLQPLETCWIPKVEECLRAAVLAGDAVAAPVVPRLAGWFTHNLTSLIMLHIRPGTPVVDYALPAEQLVTQVVWFSLRGMGLKDEAIRRYYTAESLTVLRPEEFWR